MLDGGTGSALERSGIDVSTPLWSSLALLDADGRAANDALHEHYARAGAELLIANTHNASRSNCERFLDERNDDDDPQALMDRLSRRAIESAKRTGCITLGCLASPDRPYATRASLTAKQVEVALDPQRRSLERAGADALVFEMLTTPSDVHGVASLLSASSDVDAAVGFVCRADGRLRSGMPVRDAVDAFVDSNVLGFFVQCTPVDEVDLALDAMLDAVDESCFVGVYANDGRRWVDRKWVGEGAAPEAYADAAMSWRRRGARVIGGCCGTGPAHVEAIVRRLRASC